MKSTHDFVQVCSLAVGFLVLFVGVVGGIAQSSDTVQNKANAQEYADNTTTVQSEKTSTINTPHTPTQEITSYPAVAQSDQRMSFSGSSEDSTDASDSSKAENNKETPKEIHEKAQKRAQISGGGTPVMTRTDKREILWLARIIYSETKRPREQRLVGWVVRNRVDTGYTGSTYESVAKHSNHFSGLHPDDPRYRHNMSRYRASEGKAWQQALTTAKEIYFASEEERPLAITTRHFYSPVAVKNSPQWARNHKAVETIKDPHTKETRFAFYDRVR